MKKSEIDDWELCPCESGKMYHKCCKVKGIKWTIGKDGNLDKTVPLKSEVIEIFEKQKNFFFELYGREFNTDEYVLFNSPIYGGDILGNAMVYAARKAGIEENKIYAMYKSGIILTLTNEDVMPEGFKKDYYKYYREFNKIMKSDLKSDKINALQYVLLSSDFLKENIDYIFTAICSCINDLIRRHSKDKDIASFVISDEIDYLIFSAVKTLKTLDSIKKLAEEHMPECIYALCRSLFENYMYICSINISSELFEKMLLPKVDEKNFMFDVYPDGKTNFNKVINRKNMKKQTVKINLADLKINMPHSLDQDLFSIFYQTTCQYVHVDVMSAKNYFATVNVYDEIDPALIAELISLTLALLLIYQMAQNKNILPLFCKDVIHLYKNISKKLIECFEFLKCDPEHLNVLYGLFIDRLRD